MVATVILTTAIIAGLASFKTISKGIRQSRTKTIANNIVQERMEVLKNYTYHQLLVSTDTLTNTDYTPNIEYDVVNFPPETISVWGFPVFTRYVHVTYVEMQGTELVEVLPTASDPGMKRVNVDIIWEEAEGTKKRISIKNLYADPSAATLDSAFEGHVREPDADPIGGALVEVIGHTEWNDITDAAGYYSFSVAKGSYTINASSKGYTSQTSSQKVAYRGGTTTVDITLVEVASGTAVGIVWIATNIVISQVAASSGAYTALGTDDYEWVELYNPTTYLWTLDGSSLELWYREKGSGPAMAEIPLTFLNTTISSHGYFLIASTSPIWVNGSSAPVDAVYTTFQNTIKNARDGGVGIKHDAAAAWYDRVAWEKSGAADPPGDLTEGTVLDVAGGLGNGQALERYAVFGTLLPGIGNNYDTDNNALNFTLSDPLTVPPRYSSAAAIPVFGRPAVGAYITADDGLSTPMQCASNDFGGSQERCTWGLTLATGTWTVTLTSGTLKLEVANVVITQGNTTQILSTNTAPSRYIGMWDGTSILTSTTSGGFVQGYVYGAGAAQNTPLPNILVDAGGIQTRTSGLGYYFVNVETAAAVTVTANFGQDDPAYAVLSDIGAVTAGSVSTIKAAPYFHLPAAGILMGYVTSGTGALPNIPIRASVGSLSFSAPTGQTGYFYISVSTNGTPYTLIADVDPLQSYTSLPTDPLTGLIDDPSEVVHVGTFTITGGMGTISGTVTDGGKLITTGVLLIASEGAIDDPPVAIYGSSAAALSDPVYAVASDPNGGYSLEVRAGTFNMSAYYPAVDPKSGSVSYVLKTKAGVAVTAGTATGGQNFTWP